MPLITAGGIVQMNGNDVAEPNAPA